MNNPNIYNNILYVLGYNPNNPSIYEEMKELFCYDGYSTSLEVVLDSRSRVDNLQNLVARVYSFLLMSHPRINKLPQLGDILQIIYICL